MTHKLHPDVLRVELRDYIDNASDEELQDLYTYIDSKTPPYEWWNDEEFVSELDRQYADFKSGKEKGVSWEEVKASLLSQHKTVDNASSDKNLNS